MNDALESLPRQIVVCCDGTNNTLTAHQRDTNVLRLYEHLKSHPAPRRQLYYDPGVGAPAGSPPTDPFDAFGRGIERLSELASGRGIYDNISDAYLFLVNQYRGEPDQIYLFGFSRGAFTVRCVAGMVHLFGLIRPEHAALLPTLIQIYFSLPADKKGTAWQELMRRLHNVFAELQVDRARLAQQVREDFTSPPGRDAWVHCVGVWDTVEAVGLPGPLSRSNPSTATFRDKRVRHVRHALAFDEHRWTFEPRLYEEPHDIIDAATQRSFKQRWFPGDHRDVGGSGPPASIGLSNASLDWMVNELSLCDLALPAITSAPTATLRHDPLWSTPWWALAGMCLRDMRPRTADKTPIAVIAGPSVVGPLPSVWGQRRSLRGLVVATLLGALFFVLSGACLTPAGWPGLNSVAALRVAACASAEFARAQLASLWASGLWPVQRYAGAQPAWAMFWDFAFIACWGYLLARIASRAFAWLAGRRRPDTPLPAWRMLGFAPLAAVAGDMAENLCTLGALALHGIGTDLSAAGLLWLGGVAAGVKLGGLLACVPLLAVRLWIAMPWVRRQG